jgi:homoserine O-acetyltransferase/O-succinyltransferase
VLRKFAHGHFPARRLGLFVSRQEDSLYVVARTMSEFSTIYAESIPARIYRATLAEDLPIKLDCGQDLGPVKVAYQTFGQSLNATKGNAILVCHAFTGDQFPIGGNPVTKNSGWWECAIGPDKAIDTNKFHVICSNVLGGCMGTTGPLEKTPGGDPYGLTFPVITIQDMVKVQQRLIKSLGIHVLHCVVGGSMGGMQALAWDTLFPESANRIAVLAAAPRNSAQNIAFNEVGRHAIRSDPNWLDGNYARMGVSPSVGLKTARMLAHIGYLSQEGLQQRFGRWLQGSRAIKYGHDMEYQVESYLNHQGERFVTRFDALSYVYLTRAMDYFDLAFTHGGDLSDAFRGGSAAVLVSSFDSDWHYPTKESQILVEALEKAGRSVTFREFNSDRGHDSFLLPHDEFLFWLKTFIEEERLVE